MERATRHGKTRWPLAAAAVIAVGLGAATAEAQAPGDQVRIETTTGVVEGALVDRVPEGYLIRVGAGSHVVPYAIVRSIGVVPAASPSPPPPAPPPPAVVAPVGPLVDAPVPIAATPPLPRNRALWVSGRLLTLIGALGAGAGVAVLAYGIVTKSDNTCHAGDVTLSCEYGPGSRMVTGGAVTVAVGGSALIAGAIMTAVGSPPAPAKTTGGAPRVAVSPGGVTLAWTF